MQAKQKVGKSWYDWNITNWGCKWDVAVADNEEYPETELIADYPNGENHVLVYQFDTPWSPPVPAMLKLSEQYPKLLLTLSYEEEQGWGGEMEFLRGKCISSSEYDDKCYECDATNTMDYCEKCECNVCSACGNNREEDKCTHERAEA